MKKILFAFALLALLTSESALAQVRNHRESTGKRVIKSEKLYSVASRKTARAKKGTTTAEANKFWASNARAYGLSGPQALALVGEEKDNLGMTHVRYQQVHKGVKVLGADAIVHLGKDGLVETANAQLAGLVAPDMSIKIQKDDAVKIALSIFQQETGINGAADNKATTAVVAPGLLFNLPGDKSSYLTWEVVVSAGSDLSQAFYIDTKDGSLRYEEDRIRRLTRRIADCSSGTCRYGLVGSYRYGRREGDAPSGPDPVYGSTDTDFVYDTFGNIHDYLLTKFNRNGANGIGELGIGTYQYTAANVFIDYAGANTPGCRAAAFNTTYGYIGLCHNSTTLDIVAHEYAHGLTRAVRPMTYWGETGALDESYSDVFGELFQKYATNSTDWNHADKIGSVRNLANPPASGERQDPDRFYSPLTQCGSDDLGGVHDNSTILSHAAYLMAQGTALATPFNGCTIRPIDTDKLEQIAYRANTRYYASNETFNGAYLDWIQACSDLYGATSNTCKQVTRALQAVELDQPGYCSGVAARVPACKDLCTDTDRGIQTTIPGAVYDPATKTTKRDACVLGNSSVRENYCDGDVAKWQFITCPNGCDSAKGACK